MKKMIILSFLLTTIIMGQAQVKPNKEQTVKFIESNLKKIIGITDRWGKKYFDVSFDGKVLSVSQSDESVKVEQTDKYSELNWEGVTFDVRDDEKSTAPGFVVVQLSFSTNYKQEITIKQYLKVLRVDQKTRFYNWLLIYMPADKVESLKKGFLRLQEIAKEENKDPFN